jgi:hypothetical protein
MHIFTPPQEHDYIFAVYFLKKTKETPNSKLKNLWQINIYIVPQKT